MTDGLHFWNIENSNGKKYFSCADYNGLFEINEDLSEARYILSFNNEELDQVNLHRKGIVYDKFIYYIPFQGHGVSEYNSETEEVFFYSMTDKSELISYSNAFLVGNKIYMIPACHLFDFAIFDCGSKEFRYISSFTSEIKKNVATDFSTDLNSAVIVNGKIYTAIWKSNFVVVFDVETEQVSFRRLSEDCSLRNISLIDNNLWITQVDREKVITADLSLSRIQQISSEPGGLKVIQYIDKVILIPATSKYLSIYNDELRKFERCSFTYPLEFWENLKPVSRFLGHTISNREELILYPKNSDYCLKLAGDLSVAGAHKVKCNQGDLVRKALVSKKFNKIIQSKSIIKEGDSPFLNLNDFISYLMM